jgi:hypothetical protein
MPPRVAHSRASSRTSRLVYVWCLSASSSPRFGGGMRALQGSYRVTPDTGLDIWRRRGGIRGRGDAHTAPLGLGSRVVPGMNTYAGLGRALFENRWSLQGSYRVTPTCTWPMLELGARPLAAAFCCPAQRRPARSRVTARWPGRTP